MANQNTESYRLISFLFTKAGTKVILAARNKEKAEQKAKSINENGGDAYVIRVDVTDPGSVEAMAREVNDNLGGIDVLVNAFGIGLIKPLPDIDPATAK